MIPELVERIEYRKGSYYADAGDFSGAGSAEITPLARVAHGELEAGAGGEGFRRLLVLDSHASGRGELLWALEANRYDGPWRDVDEDVRKINATLRHAWQLDGATFSLMAMAYDNEWNSADQIPRRAVTGAIIDELGSLDPTTGGRSARYSLSAHWDGANWNAALYVIDYSMSLWSNFTYFLDATMVTSSARSTRVASTVAGQRFEASAGGMRMQHAFGADWRYDDIANVGLYHSRMRRTMGVVRSDAVDEISVGIWWETAIHWTEQWRSSLARADAYRFDVDPRARVNAAGIDLSANGGRRNDSIVSLKAGLMRTMGEHAEFYVSAGQGFHSNDARGVTARVDPGDGAALKPIEPLVRSCGAETGLRVFSSERLNASIGAVAATRQRTGLRRRCGRSAAVAVRATELRQPPITASPATGMWTSSTRAAMHVSGAVILPIRCLVTRFPGRSTKSPRSVSAPAAATDGQDSLRARHFGPRALDENGEHRSRATTVLNLRVVLARQGRGGLHSTR